MIVRSFFPFFLMPQWIPQALNPGTEKLLTSRILILLPLSDRINAQSLRRGVLRKTLARLAPTCLRVHAGKSEVADLSSYFFFSREYPRELQALGLLKPHHEVHVL